MYASHFGLHKNPFGLTPDPSFLFLTEQHRDALVGLTYAITHRLGYVTLTGEVGTGKTTLLARVLQFLPASKLQFSLVMNPTLTPSEFLELVLLDFGVKDVPASKARRIWILQDLLLQAEKQGKVSALVVDEAHKLSPEILEEVRLLGNFEASDRKMLQIVLAGQPELDVALRRTDLRQLKQRIAMRLLIRPLQAEDVSKYVRHRWLRAGGEEPPFTREALSRIAEVSRGIPRVINSLCDTSLISAFAGKSFRVEASHVWEAVADLDLSDLAVESILERQLDERAEFAPQPTENVLAEVAARDIPLPQEREEEQVVSAPVETVPPKQPDLPADLPADLPEKIPFDTRPKDSLWTRWARRLPFRTREGAA
jgi:type II secretory pathway predicted ATPase ExeA